MKYTKTTWVNGGAPPINASNLNHLESQYDAAISSLGGAMFSVADFGALGSGVDDDTASIRAAFAACTAAGGGVVSFERGKRYLLMGTVTVGSNTHVEGNDATIYSPPAGSNITFTNDVSNGLAGYGAGGRNITFRRLHWLGDYAAGAGDVTTGWMHVDNLSFLECSFSQGLSNGHYIDLGGCRNVRAINCNFNGMNAQAGREYVEAIQLDVATYSGSSSKLEPKAVFDGYATRSVLVQGCQFSGVTVNGVEYPTANPMGSHAAARSDDFGCYQDIKFIGNRVTGFMPAFAATAPFGWLHIYGARGVIIADNSFCYTGPVNPNGIGAVIYCEPVLSVTMDYAASSPASVTLGAPRECKDLIIRGNAFLGFANGPRVTDGEGLIWLDSCVRATIDANVSDGMPASFVYTVNYGRRVISSNNAVEQTNAGATSGAFNYNLCENSVIANNSIGAAGGKTTGITLYRGSFPSVSGNTITGCGIGIWVHGVDNGVVSSNVVVGYVDRGIVVGDASNSQITYDLMLNGNRSQSKVAGAGAAIAIGPKATRARRFGNLVRDPGGLTDSGVSSATVATDQTT